MSRVAITKLVYSNNKAEYCHRLHMLIFEIVMGHEPISWLVEPIIDAFSHKKEIIVYIVGFPTGSVYSNRLEHTRIWSKQLTEYAKSQFGNSAPVVAILPRYWNTGTPWLRSGIAGDL